jgi:hypothetical protein
MKRLPRHPLAGGALSFWIASSPWIWGFADSHSAVANHVAFVLGLGPLALLIANLRPAAFVTLLGGAWLAVGPWLLGYAGDHAAWANELVTGLLLMVLSVSAAGLGTAIPRSIMHRSRQRTPPSAVAQSSSR